MNKSIAAKALRVFAVVLLASCFGEATGPDMHVARLNIQPAFDVRGLRAVDVNRVRVLITRLGGSPTVVDTTVAFPATSDTLDLGFQVIVQGNSEDFELSLFMLDDPGGVVVFQSGPDVITVLAGSGSTSNTVVPVPLYVGVGHNAAGVRFVGQQPGSVYFGDSVTFVAEAFDSNNVTLPNTPIVWSSSDTTRAQVRSDSMGRFIAKSSRGNINAVASLLKTLNNVTPPNVSRPLAVQPVANALAIQSGGAQSGPAGQPLPLPVRVRANAADNLGVQGIVVTFAVTAGGGSLSALVDTTDAQGDVTTNWTLGPGGGAQSISASAPGITGSLAVGATATSGQPTHLVYTTPPSNVVAGSPITPAIVVTAQDAGNVTATSFTGNVTLALGTNPGGATLGGTLTRAAINGVATFTGITLDNISNGYTLTASTPVGGVTGATSTGFNVTAPANVNAWINAGGGNWSTAANWSLGTVPSFTDTVWIKQPGTYTVNLDVNGDVARLDVGGTSGTQTLQVNANSLIMSGNGAFGANGRLTLGGTGTIRGAGTLDIAGGLDWTAGTFGNDGGTTRVLAGGTLTISGTTARNLITHTLELGGTGTWSGTAQVNTGNTSTMRILAGATLAVTGDPQFNLNQGGSALFDNQGTVNRTTSANNFVVNLPIVGNGAWNVTSGVLDIQGGGTPNGTFTTSAGTFILVNNGTFTFGAGSTITGPGDVNFNAGTTTLTGAYTVTGTTRVQGGTANFSGAGTQTAAALSVSSGTLGGSGLLTVSGAMTWSGGSMVGGGGSTRVLSSGSLAISGTVNRFFTNYTLEQASATGTWSGTATLNSGLASVLRILGGGTIDVQGTPLMVLNQGGATLFDNQGTLLKSGGGTFQVTGTFTNTGTVTATNGTMQLSGGGTLVSAIGITSPAVVQVANGTFSMGQLDVTGTGRLQLTGGTLSVPNASDTARFTTLELNGGTLAQTGVVRVGTLLDWTGGTTVSGTGKVLVATGAMNMSGSAGRTLTNGILENNGNATWSGTFQVNSGLGAVLRNMPGATFNLTGDGLFTLNQGGTALFDNLGTFNKTTSGNSINWSVPFDQAAGATSAINTGTFGLGGGGNQRGTFTVSSGAFLDYSNGVFTFSSHQASGAGTVRWQGGTLNTATASDSAKFGNLQLNGGTIAETGVVLVGGLLDWAGNTVISGTGKVRVPNTASFTITGTAGRTFTNGTIENAGVATWSGTLQINTGLNAVMRNLPGANFTLSGDGLFTQNQGFPQALFDNQGIFTRNLSAGTATWGVFYTDTSTSNLNIVSGVFALSGGARFGGGTKAISLGATLDFTAGTVSARQATVFNGSGLLRASGGSLFAPDSASAVAPVTNAVNAFNFDLTGNAALAHEGLFIVGNIMNWTGGTISSNTAAAGGLGGTTRISGTLNITNAAAVNLTGAHTLDNQGTINFSGNTINTGLGPVINNAGNFQWTGGSSILNNQGAPTLQFNNVGNLQKTTNSNACTLDAVMNKTGGFNITAGSLVLPRGSVTNFSGAVNGAATLDLSGGTFAITGAGAMTMAGNLIVSGATLDLAGHGLGVAGTFTTIGAGNLVMTSAADSLDINGNASFGGGTGTLSNGVIHAQANFTQTGVATYQPGPNTSPQRLVLDGAGIQTLTFANTVNSFFRRLEINKAAGNVTLASNVKASWVHLINSATMTLGGPFRLLTDTLSGTNFSATVSPLVVENTSVLTDSGAFLPDTAVFTGANQSIPNGTFTQYAYKSIRIAQASGTAAWNLANGRVLPNDLVISSGSLNLGGHPVGVTGNFRTENTGALQMALAADSLGVGGNITFGGGSTAGLLTNGQIGVGGNFTQSGAAASFAPSGATQRTIFARPGSAVIQQVNFANATSSFFDSVMVNRGSGTRGTVNFQTDARITRGMSINNSSDVTGATARITIAGGTVTIPQVTTSGTLNSVLAVELNQAPVIGPGAPLFSPDTTVFNGTSMNLPVQVNIQYKSIRSNLSGTLTMAPDTIAADLDIASGTASLSSGAFGIGGKLRTRGSGILAMPIGAGAPTIQVADSAIFGGGTSAPQTGTLRFLGTFNATGGAYEPVSTHNSVFAGNIAGGGGQRVLFTSPGIAGGNSWFGNLFVGRAAAGSSAPTGIALTSNAFVTGALQDTSSIAVDSILGGGFSLTAVNLSIGSNFVMNNALLVLNNPASVTMTGSPGLTFRNMSTTATQFTMILPAGGAISMPGLNFQTAPTTGRYFNFTAPSARTVSVGSSTTAFASFNTGNESHTNVTVIWPPSGQPLP